MNIWAKCWHSTGFSCELGDKAALTDGRWGRVRERGPGSEVPSELWKAVPKYSDRKTGSKIHPILSRNRPSRSQPPAVSTSREAERSDGERLEQRGGSGQRGTSSKRDVGMHAKLLQSYQTLCHTIYCGPPGSSVHGILQARILEWVAISFSRGSFRPRDWTRISCIGRRVL